MDQFFALALAQLTCQKSFRVIEVNLAQYLIALARLLYAINRQTIELKATVYAFDKEAIDL